MNPNTKPAVARIWQGRTRESLAERYAAYLYEEDEIRAYADAEFLLELPPHVQHFDILVDER